MTVPPADSATVRAALVDTLRRDLVGPGPEDTDIERELLSERPSRWYLTGFLVPVDAPEDQRVGTADQEGEVDSGADAGGLDDAAEPDHASARRAFFPSSIGMSILVEDATPLLIVDVNWGDYRRETIEAEGLETPETDDPPSADREEGPTRPEDEGLSEGQARTSGPRHKRGVLWRRTPMHERLQVYLSEPGLRHLVVPRSDGLKLAVVVRSTTLRTESGDRAVQAVSLFVVNHRPAMKDPRRADEAFAFQAQIVARAERPFVARSDLHALESEDWDERLGDLHYRDAAELAVGHNVSVDWAIDRDGSCREVWTTWFPLASVPRVVPASDVGCELEMQALGALVGPADALAKLDGMVGAYRTWIQGQRKGLGTLVPRRREVVEVLLDTAHGAALRIEEGSPA